MGHLFCKFYNNICVAMCAYLYTFYTSYVYEDMENCLTQFINGVNNVN